SLMNVYRKFQTGMTKLLTKMSITFWLVGGGSGFSSSASAGTGVTDSRSGVAVATTSAVGVGASVAESCESRLQPASSSMRIARSRIERIADPSRSTMDQHTRSAR